MWGAAAGAAGIGAAGQGMSGIISGLWGKYGADKAWKRQKKVLKNQIQWRVGDMRQAGLNPLLSISGGVSGGAGAVPQGRAGPIGAGPDFAGAMQKVSSAHALRASAEKDLESAELLYAQRYGQQLNNTILEKQLAGTVELEMTTAKQLEEMYRQYPWLRKARAIVETMSPFIPKTSGSVNVNKRR